MSGSTLHIILLCSVLGVIYKDLKWQTLTSQKIQQHQDSQFADQVGLNVAHHVGSQRAIDRVSDSTPSPEMGSIRESGTYKCLGFAEGFHVVGDGMDVTLTDHCSVISLLGENTIVYADKVDFVQIMGPNSIVYYRGDNPPRISVMGTNSYVKRMR